MKNYDFKSIFLIILTLLIILLGFNYFKSDSDYKNKVKSLKEENKKLKKSRDSLSKNILILEKEFKLLKEDGDSLLLKISSLDNEILDYKTKVGKSENELTHLRKKLLETNNKIKDLKNNPPNRVGDDLINSIKNKTQK
jgi:chromosome segregation ATPase